MLLDKMKKSPEFDKTIVLDEHPDVQKMSAVLLDYAEPLTAQLPVHDDKAFRNAIGVAVMCWNAALASRNEREEMLRQFASRTSDEDILPAEELREILDFMVQRKMQLYKSNKRWIINYEIKSTKRDREVYVASTLEPKQVKALIPGYRKPWWRRLLFWRK
jgi:hypothetical protein